MKYRITNTDYIYNLKYVQEINRKGKIQFITILKSPYFHLLGKQCGTQV